jgi:hypothetical protein
MAPPETRKLTSDAQKTDVESAMMRTTSVLTTSCRCHFCVALLGLLEVVGS